VKLEMITESPSKELTDIYQTATSTNGNGNGNGKGVENHSPDETTTTTKNTVIESKGDGGPGLDARKADIEGMGSQEKGEKVGSGDTTHTPNSMVYDPSTSTSNSGSKSSTTKEGSGSGSGRHPSTLLGSEHIPLLKEAFDLRPAEVLDITRAVEQADLRAKAADRRGAKAE
jgi:hypothetical protein